MDLWQMYGALVIVVALILLAVCVIGLIGRVIGSSQAKRIRELKSTADDQEDKLQDLECLVDDWQCDSHPYVGACGDPSDLTPVDVRKMIDEDLREKDRLDYDRLKAQFNLRQRRMYGPSWDRQFANDGTLAMITRQLVDDFNWAVERIEALEGVRAEAQVRGGVQVKTLDEPSTVPMQDVIDATREAVQNATMIPKQGWARDGEVFVTMRTAPKGYKRTMLADIAPEWIDAKVVKCAVCGVPAVHIDPHYPHMTSWNRCREHLDVALDVAGIIEEGRRNLKMVEAGRAYLHGRVLELEEMLDAAGVPVLGFILNKAGKLWALVTRRRG